MTTRWWELAACKGLPLSWFFWEKGEEIPVPRDPYDGRKNRTKRSKVRKICYACPVQQQCLDAAIEEEGTSRWRPSRHGIRGGLTPAERSVYAGSGPPVYS
jgi:hypothetical protein